MSAIYPINPRVRAYGKARIDIAQRVKDPGDWEKLWVRPANAFPFEWGEAWKHCVEYKVDDYPAEVGFFIDILGLEVNAFDPTYAMFTSPQGDFYLAVVPAQDGNPATPPEALRIQFMVADILSTTRELEKRGIQFDQPPGAIQPGSSLYISTFHTPHGIPIDLWGTVKSESAQNVTLLVQDDDEEDDQDDQPLEEDRYIEDDEGEPIDDDETDIDETGIGITEEEEDEDDLPFDDEEKLGDGEDDDELLKYEDEDIEDGEGELNLEDEDEYEDDDNPNDVLNNSPAKRSIQLPASSTQASFHQQPAKVDYAAQAQPEYIILDSDG